MESKGKTSTCFIFEGALLFALIIPLMMKYTLLPTLTTPYIYFGIIFFLSIINIFIHFPDVFLFGTYTGVVKNILFWIILFMVLLGSMVSSIADRGRMAQNLNYYTHDIVLQLEAALRYLSQDKNPYKETYFGTPLESWNYQEQGVNNAINPALYHFVMPPWYLVSSYSIFWISMRTVGFFDGRMPLFIVSMALFIGVFYWLGRSSLARVGVMLLALSPATVEYLLEGRSDMFALSFLVFSFIFICRKSLIFSSIFFALALLSKQTIWFIAPLYLVYISKIYRDWKKISLFIGMTGAIVLLFVAPFLIWDTKAFIESVVFYLTGNTVTSYPVSGYGLGMIFLQFGVIRDIHAYFPFFYWQIGLGIPLYVMFGYFIWKKPMLSRLILCYGVILFIIWYGSRYFNNSHVAYLSSIFLLACFRYMNEQGMT